MDLLSAKYFQATLEIFLNSSSDSKLGPAEVWTSRQALQDLYQKMLVTDLEYALDKKVEQDLCRHGL
uniref:Uncharacterized protein n=1 Tax=Catharus ustulatus TaxID=91951 RepID=A0A8C3TL81_CATUS